MSLEFDSNDFDPMDESGADEGESSWMDAAIDQERPPICYMGHEDCYNNHTSERLADEADWEQERQDEMNDREPTEHELNRYTHGHFDY